MYDDQIEFTLPVRIARATRIADQVTWIETANYQYQKHSVCPSKSINIL